MIKRIWFYLSSFGLVMAFLVLIIISFCLYGQGQQDEGENSLSTEFIAKFKQIANTAEHLELSWPLKVR